MNMKNIYNGTACYDDLKHLINSVAKDFADSPAFAYSDGDRKVEITFKGFKSDIDALGTYLYSIGFNGGKKIAVLGENSYNWVVSYFAVANGGNIVLPIDKELKPNEVANLLDRSETDLLIYSKQKQKCVDEIKETGVFTQNFICMEEFSAHIENGRELIESGNKDFIDCKINPEEMCAIIYTSGTTGIPKGVMLSQKNLVKDAYYSISCIKIPRDTVAILPLNHTFGFMASILCQIWMGYCVYMNNSVKTVLKDIKDAKPGHISVVPLYVENIYKKIWQTAEKQGKADLLRKTIKASNAMRKVGIDLRRKLFKSVLDNFGGNLEMIISGGAPIDDIYMKGFDDLGIMIINGFGITECSPIVALNRHDDIKEGTVGKPILNVNVKIENPDENGEGEIWVKGDIVMLGYYKNEEATADVIKDGWFNTGDIGKLLDDGYLKITGRKKNLIILANGKNVYPEEIETLIARIDNVTEVLVYEEDELIVAEIFSDAEGDKEKIKEQIKSDVQKVNSMLAGYKQVKKIKFRSVEFEKTTTKKIKRAYKN